MIHLLATIAIICSLSYSTFGQDLRIQLVERHVVADIITSENIGFGQIGRHLFLPGADGYSIYRYDRIKREVDMKVTGRGGGPSEFSSEIQHVFSLPDRLMLIQKGGSVKFFSPDLRYISRTSISYGVNDISKLGAEEGKYLGCIVSMADFAEKGSMHHLALINIGDRIEYDLNKYNLNITTENVWLQKCYHANNGTLVVAGRAGDNKVYYFDINGELKKEVTFTSAVKHEFTAPPPGASEVYTKYGIKDTRLPKTGQVNNIFMDPRFTVVQGGVSAQKMLSTIYVIDHANWAVTTIDLPKNYRQILFAEGKLFCLGTRSDPNAVDVFAIVK